MVAILIIKNKMSNGLKIDWRQSVIAETDSTNDCLRLLVINKTVCGCSALKSNTETFGEVSFLRLNRGTEGYP